VLCGCHGEPKVWKTDRRKTSGGYWRCPVGVRRDNQGSVRQLAYWHKSGGGYIKRRRRDLATQRAAVTVRLMELEQEAAACH
jgi:hypothetical protein